MDEKIIVRKFIQDLNLKKVNLLKDYNSFYRTYFNDTKIIQSKVENFVEKPGLSFSKDFVKQYKKLRSDILEIFRFYVKGDVLRASTKMYNILFRRKYYGKRFYEYFMKKMDNPKLYRCRKAKGGFEKEKILNHIDEEMFHIPFDQRNVVGNARFSVSGFPCLYLGSSPECCKIEIGMNDYNEIVCCSYESNEEFAYYDLTLSSKEISNFEDLKIYLLKSLIVQAVSYTINPDIEVQLSCPRDKIKNFVTYYVIPQLITASIASRGVKQKETQCIRYHSVKFIEDYNQNNYVFIPRIKRYDSKHRYDENLRSKFDIKSYEQVEEKELAHT